MAFNHSKYSQLITHAGTFTQPSTDKYQEEKKKEYLKNYFGYEHYFFTFEICFSSIIEKDSHLSHERLTS